MVSHLVCVVTDLKLTILVSTFLQFFFVPIWLDSLPEAYLNSAYMCSDTHALAEGTTMVNEGMTSDGVPMLES